MAACTGRRQAIDSHLLYARGSVAHGSAVGKGVDGRCPTPSRSRLGWLRHGFALLGSGLLIALVM